jgi:hypothetical protein
MQLTRRADQPSACDCKKERAMLKLIEESYASFFPKEMDAMFRNRAETFSERLGWEVMVKDGYDGTDSMTQTLSIWCPSTPILKNTGVP